MVDVVLNTEDLMILGGPSRVDVSVDFGPQGSRGSNIYAGLGQPNNPDTELGFTPQVLDLFINILTSDEEYMYIYQYLNVNGTRTWVKLLKLIPNLHSVNNTGNFVDGERTINIPLINIVPLVNIANLTSANFNVQYNIINNANPISSSLSIGELVNVNDEITLPLTIKAIEFDGNSWINLAGQKTVHLFITVV